MDGAELTPTPTLPDTNAVHHVARPTLGFPLGTALLLIIIFCLSGVFSCCYHWEKLRSLRRRGRSLHQTQQQQLPVASTAAAAAARHLQFDSSGPLSPSKPTLQPQDLKKESEMSLPVIMAGDRYPKFMAWPCPCPCQPTSNVSIPTGGGGGGGGMTVITIGVLLVPSAPSHSSSSSRSLQHSVN